MALMIVVLMHKVLMTLMLQVLMMKHVIVMQRMDSVVMHLPM